jgi:hypothetical protein
MFVGVSFISDLFALRSLCGVGIMNIICAVREDVDVVVLSVLLCLQHWLLLD